MLLQITVVVRLTGLLLMVPDSHVHDSAGGDKGGLPMHVLMPVEGAHVPAHFAEIGWRSTEEACTEPYVYTSDTEHAGFCWANLDGWSLDLGQGGSPTGTFDTPRHRPLIGGGPLGHAVDRTLFGPTPGRALRSRITLYSGSVTGECPFAKWDFRGETDKELTSVLTWTFTTGTLRELTLVRLQDNRGDPADTMTIGLPTPERNTLELYVRYIPVDEYAKGHKNGEIGKTMATHLHAFYDLLKVGAGARPFPLFKGETGTPCDFPKTPGSPTCMIGSAFP
ncbi:MAG TPA: hypothetical protein VJT67_05705 [Longimicrobiaceae bacterium]|nr:hypothetical protein [Longimicrobiaceae bacterium]